LRALAQQGKRKQAEANIDSRDKTREEGHRGEYVLHSIAIAICTIIDEEEMSIA